MHFRLLTWLASALLLIIFAAITALVWREHERELQVQLNQDAGRLQTAFEVAVGNLEQQMLALASLLAADPEVQHLFDQGRAAVLAEGGGAGGARAAQVRAALLARVEPQWHYMQTRFGVRQLQFHLGPGVLSFLRVHAPERYGDRMDGLRHIIEDTNRDRQPRAGFETGRVQSGVRGVVPVEAMDADGTPRLIGSLEAGTAFNTQLGLLDRQLGAGFAVLLKPEHVESSVWREYREGMRQKNGCDCYLEASSRLEFKDLLGHLPFPEFRDRPLSWLLPYQDSTLHITRIPLRDYLGVLNARRPAVGSVLIWRDVGNLVHRHRQAQMTLAGGALLGYCIAQLLLLWLLRDTQRRWKRQVEQKATDLNESEARFQLLLMGLGEGVYGVNLKGHATFINPAALRMLGLSGENVLGRDQHLLFHHHHANGRDYLHADCPVALTLADGRPRHEEGEWFWRHDGSGFPVALTVTPVLKNGVRVGAVVVFQDISERQAHANQLRLLATTDSLTGVNNRRHFLQQLEQELTRHQRYGEAAALLMLDLDHFKLVNDEFGHAAGDTVLKAFTTSAEHVLRRSDHLGRLGGEEFAILLPDTDSEGARELAERLRQMIHDTPVKTATGVVRYSVSIGIALFARGDGNADVILARADHALYRAKHSGRNRVEMEITEKQPL
ncbi:MAG: diguanylate cyclase [Pseudomonadota bacterium]|nr:diguanylate cyclase [Pseudomonadota bacterium]